MTEEDVRIIQYFWEEKGDIERWCDWEQKKKTLPKELRRAWRKYKESIEHLNLVVKNLEADSVDEEEKETDEPSDH